MMKETAKAGTLQRVAKAEALGIGDAGYQSRGERVADDVARIRFRPRHGFYLSVLTQPPGRCGIIRMYDYRAMNFRLCHPNRI